MAQPIEFFLHPPSPKHKFKSINTCTLPPVSSLLQLQNSNSTISSSCSLSSISSFNSTDLPSLNLPRSNSLSLLEPVEPYSTTLNENTSPSLSPFMGSLSLDSPPQLSPQTSPYSSWLLLPPPKNTRRCRSLSNASTNSTSSFHSTLSLNNNKTDKVADPTLYDDEEDTVDVVKRKRGRPPNSMRPHSVNHQRDSWTFVTPTVWDVKHKEAIVAAEDINSTNNEEYMVLHWPQQQQQSTAIKGENTFTNANMDTTLTIPKKKRGRKPKMQLAGNFCFVWRDLTARRGTNKKKLATVK